MKKMKTDFYDTFQCIADKCSITCCQEWKIEVDDETFKKWNSLSLGENRSDCLNNYVDDQDGYGIIRLNEKKKCPFLNKEKLCNLVINMGDEVLSRTCTIFPREIHEFGDRKEYSLVACCPEVVDILNRKETISFLTDIEQDECGALFQIRNIILKNLQNTEFTIPVAMMMNFYILLDLLEKENVSEEPWKEYEHKSVLNHLSETIGNMEFHQLDTFEERNELFLDLAENYRKQKIYVQHLEKIAVLAEEISQSYEEEKMVQWLADFEGKFAAYERLFRNYLVSEIFNTILIPESDLESMVVMLQWISLEYVVMKHAIFLNWILEGRDEIAYETVRNVIVIISRMTGYDEEDIREYIENSFQSIIWEWGYLAFIVGDE